MARSILVLLSTCVLVSVCAASARAAATDSRLVSDVDETVVAEDGSLTEDDTSALRADASAGEKDIAQRNLDYHPPRPVSRAMFEDKKPHVAVSVHGGRGFDHASAIQRGPD